MTRRGEPMADIVPTGPPDRPASWLGSMSDRIRITGDVTTPSSQLVPWNVEQD